ncbi:hypothetical protein F5Y03DRAFT_362342 [Xylaria venustula]|nr:hypothetical protein F5Y03DRAFT_362342 [Xylaria venustula]
MDPKLLQEYKDIYDQKCGICLKIQPVLIKDLENVLAYHSVKHIPVTSRVKRWDRAEETSKRRQRERLRTKELREKSKDPKWTGLSWESYCRKWQLHEEDSELLASGQAIDRAIHDLLGARIALYFPNDVDRVRHILKTSGYRDLEIKRKGGMNDLQRLRKVSDELDKNLSTHSETDEGEEGSEITKDFERAFSGYGAIHFIAKVPHRLEKRIGLPTDKWEDLVVELQVGTVVMNAWAEVEHDIIYKELDQVESFEDVQRISDLINGVALTGEVALKQLEAAIRKNKEPQALKNTYEHAQDYNQFGDWIDQYLSGKNLPTDEMPVQSDWKGLKELFEVWTIHNRAGFPFTRVVEYINRFEKAELDSLLPLRILREFSETLLPIKSSGSSRVEQARFSAFRAVSICQLATYFGCPDNIWLANEDPPRISDFLDILHPKQPECSDNQRDSIIELRIERGPSLFPSLNPNKKETDLRVEVSIRLAEYGYGAWPSPLTSQPHCQRSFTEVFTIPRNLWRLCQKTPKLVAGHPLPYLLLNLFPPELQKNDCRQETRGALRAYRDNYTFDFYHNIQPETCQPICDDSGRWNYSYKPLEWIIGHRNDFEQELSLLPAIKSNTSSKDGLTKVYTYIRDTIKSEIIPPKHDINQESVLPKHELDVDEQIEKLVTDELIGVTMKIKLAFDIRLVESLQSTDFEYWLQYIQQEIYL